MAALIGAIGFELLKLLLSGYMQGVATKSMYGAFGVPVALLLWINFTAKLVVFCAAWTATGNKETEVEGETESEEETATDEAAATEDSAAGTEGPAAESAKSGVRSDPDGASGRAAASGG